MHLFKTSGETYESVIDHQMHAFFGEPKDLFPGEVILVSKNRSSLAPDEKQISHTMEFQKIRELRAGEAERLWPGNEGRWKYLVICKNTKHLSKPFDLAEVIGSERAAKYNPVMTAAKVHAEDEAEISKYLKDFPEVNTDSTIYQTPRENDQVLNKETEILERKSTGSGKCSAWVVFLLVVAAFLLGVFLFN